MEKNISILGYLIIINMKIVLFLILAFGLIVSLAFNAYLIYDIGEVWAELMDIHDLLVQILEHLKLQSGTSI